MSLIKTVNVGWEFTPNDLKAFHCVKGNLELNIVDTVAFITPPTIKNNTLLFTNSEIVPEFIGYDDTVMTISGDTKATKAGNYSTTFTLNNIIDYTWDDGTNDPITINWSIYKNFEISYENRKYIGYTDDTTDLVIPATFTDADGVFYKVTAVGLSAFLNCTNLETVVISDGITSIKDGAFNGCTNLSSISIPDTITSMGINLFYNCTSLTEITIPDSVTSIGQNAFSRCSALITINIGDGVTSIGNNAFYECTNLNNIIIPGKVTKIGDYAFSYCTALTNIDLPDGLTYLGGYGFRDCNKLKTIVIPKSLTDIKGSTFYGCNLLSTVNYTGTEEEWKKITIATYNTPLLNATKVYNYTR